MKHADAGLPADAPKHTAPPSIDHVARKRLESFAQLLTRWNATIQLVSPGDIPELWPRHIEDALQLLPLMPPKTARAVDLGSGGGFPGLVLAIATGVPFDLIEADNRKAAFLREAAIATGARATIHARRIEDIRLPPCGLVTARALAPLPKLLDLAAPFLSQEGICLFPKGGRAEFEIDEAKMRWSMVWRQFPSLTSAEARIIQISHLQRRSTFAQ